MRPFARVPPGDYLALDLRAHGYLADVPLHDVWRVFLPGKGRPCTMTEVRAVARAALAERPPGPLVRALFALRRLAGRAFRWDRTPPDPGTWSFQHRVTVSDRQRSLVPPGTQDGPFTVLYVHATEALSEIRNATVHAFLVWAVRPVPGGHALFFAIHVRPVHAWTRVYMATIDPVRRRIVYPSLLRWFHDAWRRGAGMTERPS